MPRTHRQQTLRQHLRINPAYVIAAPGEGGVSEDLARFWVCLECFSLRRPLRVCQYEGYLELFHT